MFSKVNETILQSAKYTVECFFHVNKVYLVCLQKKFTLNKYNERNNKRLSQRFANDMRTFFYQLPGNCSVELLDIFSSSSTFISNSNSKMLPFCLSPESQLEDQEYSEDCSPEAEAVAGALNNK